MSEIPLLAILFPTLIVGMQITMFISYVFIESPRNRKQGDQLAAMPLEEALQKQRFSQALIEKTA